MAVLSQESITVAARTYDKYITGEHFTDKEIKEYLRVSSDVCSFLQALGPKFHLPWKELDKVRSDLLGIQKFRKEHPY